MKMKIMTRKMMSLKINFFLNNFTIKYSIINIHSTFNILIFSISMYIFKTYNKLMILLCVCLFLITPIVVFAELPPEVSYERVCESAFGGKVVKIENYLICQLPSGELCISDSKLEGDNYKYDRYQSCDNYTERACVKEGRAEYAPCCDDLSLILEKSAYDLKCKKIPAMPGPGWSYICTNCGDSICGAFESKCNCPEDCQSKNVFEKINIFKRIINWFLGLFK